jgi:pimeloyl-ACP methyl ester carboxylesterase
VTGRPILVLLPGLLCDAALWRHQIESLCDLVKPWVADLTQDATVGAMAERVLAAAPDRFLLAGLSMGGYVAFEMLRRAAERVSKLALLDTTARAYTPDQRRRRLGLLRLAEHGTFKGVTPRLLPQLIHPARLGEAELTRTILDMGERIGREAYVRQQTAILDRRDSRDVLRSIAVHTLVLCGADDELTPLALHRELAADIPDSRLAVLAETGHLPPLERPERVSAEMRKWIERMA